MISETLSQPGPLWLTRIAITSTLICLLGWLVVTLFRHRSADVQASVWRMVSCATLLTAILLFVAPGLPLGLWGLWAGETTLSPAAEPNSIRDNSIDTNFSKPLTAAANPEIPNRTPSPTAAASSPTATAKAGNAWPTVVIGIWLVVAGWFTLRLTLSIAVASSIAREGAGDTSPRVEKAFQEVRTRLGIVASERIGVRVSERMGVPYVVGVVRPKIVLPAEYFEWSDEKLAMVLAHELAHIQRHDILFQWLSSFTCAVTWFNPIVWLSSYRGVLERERACDDRVLGCGFEPTDYGRNLVEIAAAYVQQSKPMHGVVSMSSSPLRKRLDRVLNDGVDRKSSTLRTRAFVLTFFSIVAVSLGVLRPLTAVPADEPAQRETPPRTDPSAVPDKAEVKANEQELFQVPNSVTCRVVDRDGEAIGNAKIVLEIRSTGGGSWRRWEATTNASGRCRIETRGVGKLSKDYYFLLSEVSADGFVSGYLSADQVLSVSEIANGKSMGAVLMRSRRLTGRLRPAANAKLTGAFLRAAGTGPITEIDTFRSWISTNVPIDDHGGFSIDVPSHMQCELLFQADDHAAQHVLVNEDEQGNVQLEHGQVVRGTLVTTEGNPIPNALLAMAAYDATTLKNLKFGAEYAVHTNAKGEFTFPPGTGIYTIWSAPLARVRTPTGYRTYISTPHAVIPRVVTLKDGEADLELTLKTTDTRLISGVARWEDDTPVQGLEVTAFSVQTRVGVDIVTTETDAEGKYQLRVPTNLKPMTLRADGIHDKSGEFHSAFGRIGRGEWEEQFADVGELINDIEDANWEIRRGR